jgi:O-antigen biosynthesis protein
VSAVAAEYRASIVVVVNDQVQLLLRCLNGIARLGDDAGFEAVVVDDASTDATPSLLASVDGDFQTLRSDVYAGYGACADRAVAAARGEHLIFLREDAVPADGWFDRLLSALDADPSVGAVRGAAVCLDGAVMGGGDWACLAVRREAFEAAGGFAGSARYARSAKMTLLDAMREAGWDVAEEPAAVVLLVPDRVAA